MDRSLSRDEAKARLNRCIEDGTVIYSRHFRDELMNDGLTISDVLTVCRGGAVIMAPEKDIKTGDWKYRIEGLTSDQCRVAVVFAFRPEQGVLITLFRRT
jgi:hypothetical protein